MHRRSKRAVWVLLVGLVILGALQTPLLKSVRGWWWDWWVYMLGRATGYEPISSESALREQALLAENIRLKAELKDYERLRRQLGTPARTDWRTVPVAFVGRPLDIFQSQFLLSKGAGDGLVIGAPVVINGSTLVGLITELKEHSAVGQLLTASDTTLAAQVAPEPASGPNEVVASGLVRGQHYTALRLTTVPRDAPLKIGQAVVTEIRSGTLPFGLFIGTVGTIESSANDVYQEATLQLPYDADQLRAGVVLLPR